MASRSGGSEAASRANKAGLSRRLSSICFSAMSSAGSSAFRCTALAALGKILLILTLPGRSRSVLIWSHAFPWKGIRCSAMPGETRARPRVGTGVIKKTFLDSTRLDKVIKITGMDSNVGWTFFARLSSMAAGFLSIFPVLHFLSTTQQGYYYTFSSIIALQSLFELGLTQILIQVTSHEFPFLIEKNSKEILSNIHGRRLSYFAGFANRWYQNISLTFAVVVSIGGVIYFIKFGNLPFWQWGLAWICLIVLTSANLYISPRMAFIEGAGFPGKVAALRLKQTLGGYALLVAMLWAGMGLWAVTAIPLTQLVLGLYWLAQKRSMPNFFHRTLRIDAKEPEWRSEIMNLQWRVALSWVGGYLATLVLTPMIFAYQGAEAAGRWGLSFSLMSQLIALGTSWTTANTPRYGELIARRARRQLDRKFFSSSVKTVVLIALGCCALMLGVILANYFNLKIINRIMSIDELFMLSIATIASGAVFCFAVYVRAHKEEPLVTSSLVIGVMTVISSFFMAHVGTFYVVFSYMAITLIVNLPWRYAIYAKYRSRGLRLEDPEITGVREN